MENGSSRGTLMAEGSALMLPSSSATLLDKWILSLISVLADHEPCNLPSSRGIPFIVAL